ncbi:MAG TPA: arginine--tRNA ligase [Candidatus Saccharimonadales bacterium]|nr:arginine--tRNA ligase [Candidatus Saccharimonadales bacterium]
MKSELENQIAEACQQLFGDAARNIEIDLDRPEEQFGDYATNVALKLAKNLGKVPREIAEPLAVKLRETLSRQISEINIAGPGFINIKLKDQVLWEMIKAKPAKSLNGKKIVAEYSDPNPFKVLHGGHLYTSLVGDALANLMELAGGVVNRVNFGGDVGLHVGKTIWSIVNDLGGEHPEKLTQIHDDKKLDWVGEHYVKGNTAYEQNENAKTEIIYINQRIYELHKTNDQASQLAKIYWTCRQWSYDGFEQLYKQLEMKPFDKYYPESEVADLGLETVRQHIGSVYEKSEGAVIYRGEKHGLFTQVFISSEELPTYAAKDVGLIFKKQRDYSPDQSFIITDHAQKDHLTVVLQSIKEFAPELAEATTHLSHGQIKMTGGGKMSSRSGNILKATDILQAARSASVSLPGRESPETVLAAVRYAFLKNRIGSDIIYDPKESVSLEGNSGPYLQYAHARACSIIKKASVVKNMAGKMGTDRIMEPGERTLALKITEYVEVIDKAVIELLPHLICTYLYELAQDFNHFYESNRVLNDPRQAIRLQLVSDYASTLSNGLKLLGIAAPQQM